MHPIIRKAGSALALARAARPSRTVWIGHNFTRDMADSVVSRLVELNDQSPDKFIWLRVNSDGGDTLGTIRVVDTLRIVSTPSIAVVYGEAHSSALLLIQGATIRLGAKGSRYYLQKDRGWNEFVQASQG